MILGKNFSEYTCKIKYKDVLVMLSQVHNLTSE